MTAETIARELEGRRSGTGWILKCPSHDDRSPSLSLSERNGKILVRCFAGCPQSDVIAALRARGLWPEPPKREWTPDQRKAWARQRQQDERDKIDARLFADVAVILAEQALEQMDATDPERRGLTRLIAVVRGPSLLGEYREWRRSHPEMAAALVRGGREHQRRVQTLLAHFLIQGDSVNGSVC